MPADQSLADLAHAIKQWGRELGFQQVGITDTGLSDHETRLQAWLDKGYHADMQWMQEHGSKRSRPAELLPGTVRVISVRMDYLPGDPHQARLLKAADKAYIARYALGRDYHKLMRKRLAQLAKKIEGALGTELSQRAFVDSAPVLERALAEKAGLGWIGKSTMLVHRKAGTWFFLGELLTNLPLPVDQPATNHCGSCRACLDICPTNAFVGAYELDASKCISYLTIENKGSIPEELRPALGNRVFGCDDCQLICPWNKFARFTEEDAFKPRHQLDAPQLVDLFLWSEEEFLTKTAGSAIRRLGHERWLRNLAVALGNAPRNEQIIRALTSRLDHPSELVHEHVEWALARQEKAPELIATSPD